KINKQGSMQFVSYVWGVYLRNNGFRKSNATPKEKQSTGASHQWKPTPFFVYDIEIERERDILMDHMVAGNKVRTRADITCLNMYGSEGMGMIDRLVMCALFISGRFVHA
ncbi:MAG TPA: hypothetical protein V6C97_02070, partial [Oculatellaceae cyanobacterium]